ETSAKQGTWGKQIVGIKVTDIQGRRITTGRAIGRFFAKIITGMTCGIGYLLPLFTDRKQTLHDLISECLALKT
ncbi:MAG: RDD family protein, partial [Planctomycetia bacterium]|nr:RDD family protein [Planctomycetia bacterium]